MASTWRQSNSPFYTACYTDETGRRMKRSTKLTDRKKALKMAEAFEDAAKLAKGAELTRTAAMKVLNELMERTHGEGIDNRSTRQHVADYQAGIKTKESTLKRYRPIFDGFLAHLGEARADARLASVTSQELESFRNAELKAGKSAGTADFALKVLNGLFKKALKYGIIQLNPVGAVDALENSEKEWEKAVILGDSLASLLPNSAAVWMSLARARAQLGCFTEAREALQRAYPPKAIVGLAGVPLFGEPLKPEDFTGGAGSKCFKILTSHGFQVVPKAAEFPPTADENALNRMTMEALSAPCLPKPNGQREPAKFNRTSVAFERDPLVRAFVLMRAAGKCECCGKDAPFVDQNGVPFLELHQWNVR